MKQYFTLLTLILLIVSCQPTTDGELPASLDGKRAVLKEKQDALKALNSEIAELEVAILAQDPNAKEQGVLVSAIDVKRSDFTRYVVFQGNVAADDFYDATAEIAGRILSLTVKEGSVVRKGQLIATLDVEVYQTQRAELETTLELANIVYERQKRLWDQKIGSEMQFLQAENAKKRLEKSLVSMDVQLAKNKVYAPISGVVEHLVLQTGELASPGMPIVKILNTSQLKVMADVPENYIMAINRGDKVEVNVLALNMVKTLSVSLIGKTVNPANRTFKVEVKLPANTALKPNLLADMKFVESVSKGVVTIPLDLVQQEVGGQRYVYIIEDAGEDKMARKVNIVIGDSYEGNIVIKEGLKGGEVLIEEGARNLSDGQIIEIIQNKSTK